MKFGVIPTPNHQAFKSTTTKRWLAKKVLLPLVEVIPFGGTGGPRYMRSFYMRFRVYAIEKWPFFWNLSSNLWES